LDVIIQSIKLALPGNNLSARSDLLLAWLPFGSEVRICCQREAAMMLTHVDTEAPPFVPEPITDDEAGAMFRAVLKLFDNWGLNDEQASILLDLPIRTYRRWKSGDRGRIDRDGKARLSNLLGIHKALRIIFEDAPRGYRWIKAPNEAFAGRSALEVMLGGELTDLMRVRRYLDAERGGW
jgi:hypothetical protein